MQVKTVEQSTHEWIRKSIMAFLEGEKDLKWIASIAGQDVSHAREALLGLKDYGDPERYRRLLAWCENR